MRLYTLVAAAIVTALTLPHKLGAQRGPVSDTTSRIADRVFDAYRASEHDFRTAFDNSRSYSNSKIVRFVPPSVMKPILEVVAIAHRRRGTWA